MRRSLPFVVAIAVAGTASSAVPRSNYATCCFAVRARAAVGTSSSPFGGYAAATNEGSSRRRGEQWWHRHSYRHSHRHSRQSAADEDEDESNNSNSSNYSHYDADWRQRKRTQRSVEAGRQQGTEARGFLQSLDSLGMRLKPLASQAKNRSVAAATRSRLQFRSIAYAVQSYLLWSSYILYRAQRGVFVILPPLFEELFRKFDESQIVDADPFGRHDGHDDDAEAQAAIGDAEQTQTQTSIKWRTRCTISVLAGILTATYVMSGGLRVIAKFVRTLADTTSLETSFEAAAEELAFNEQCLIKSSSTREATAGNNG